MIPDSIVEEIRERTDLVEVVGRHVELKKSGSEFKALCPFHNEKTPSFYVVPDKGFYKCFGCGAAGDVFDFLMKQVGLSFPEAARQLADQTGVAIPDAADERREEPYRRLYEVMAFAAEHYERRLQQAEDAESARRYLESRGVEADVARRFRLGHAPDAWRALREAAHGLGIDDEALLQVGLIKESERTDEPYDRLRNRIVFPITDLRGRVIAFGGRVLDPNDRPKYLNSPETPIYQKGRTLYGLAWSKNAIRKEGAALVVEGYMDYVSLAAHGLEHVVAPLGTAMTEEQATLLSRYTRRALLLYDSDPAGQRATFRTGDALLRTGVQPLVVPLPAGEDPDTIVRREGGAGLRERMDAATDVLDRKIQILEERGYFDDIDGRRRSLDGLLPTVRAVMEPALRDLYIDRVVQRTGVRRETLERELAETPRRRAAARSDAPASGAEGRVQEAGPGRPEQREAGGSRGVRAAPAATAERLMLVLLLRDPERVEQVRDRLEVDAMQDPVYREMYGAFLRHGVVDGVEDRLSEPARRRLEHMRLDPVDLSPADRVLEDQLTAIRAENLFARLEDLDARRAFAGDTEAMELMRERTGIHEELRRLGFRISRRWKDRAASAAGAESHRREV